MHDESLGEPTWLPCAACGTAEPIRAFRNGRRSRTMTASPSPSACWRVRYFSTSLRHEMQSRDFATESEALAAAYDIAQDDGEITAIEGPDGEIIGTDEIEVWFREHDLVMPPVRPG
jgi:hypothetical protein